MSTFRCWLLMKFYHTPVHLNFSHVDVISRRTCGYQPVVECQLAWIQTIKSNTFRQWRCLETWTDVHVVQVISSWHEWMNEWMNEGNAWSRWPLNISSYLIFWISSEWAWRQPCIHTPALNGLPIPSSALCRLSLSAASNQLWNVSLQVSLHKHKTPN